ncbi:hypothetical protein QYE76_001184 [Lolium multiflorum]|uniref:Reverse transcriptase domain-containing protein n=1 Tax=Lolium multiflorum TaxID=4521 RepID=A0AAD8VYC3_LOLMU|nr:hypothetical protein QYE76_001184 [Lolium multiflorum]
MSITLGEATKLLDNMMINYSEWHTERAPQGKKVNSVEETSSLSDKIDAIMSMLVNDRTNIDPNNVPLASLVAQEEHVDVNFIKNNNFNNNAYRNNSSNNYRPYPYNNGNGYGNSYGNSYNNNRSSPPGLEAMLKEFISIQTAFNKSVEEKLGKIDILASKVDSLASDVDLLKSKVMPNRDIENKIVTTANAIQVRINENIRLMAELRARWDREENEKLAKEKNVAKVWTITTTSNANATHVAAPPTINNKRIGVSNVSTSNAKREKLPETAETACDKTAEIFSNIGDDDPIALDYNGLNFDDCHISEVIKFLQKLAKSPNASAINLAFTQHITNALIKAREEKLERKASIPRKLEDGWEPIIKMKVKDFDCNALCDLGASISVMPKKIYNMLDLPPLKNCYLDVNLADHSTKKPLGKVDNVRITINNNLVPIDFVVLDIECNASCPIILGRPFLRTVGAIIDMKEEILVTKYSRNWTKSTPRVLFCHEASKTEEETKWGHEVPALRAAPLAARPRGVGPSCRLLTCPSAYLKPPLRNPSTESHDTENLPDAAAADPISGSRDVRTSPERGFISRGLYAAMVASGQQDGPEPTHDDGSPFEFFPPAPVVLFCKSSPPLKKVVMQSQPISPKSASKSKVSSGPAAPRAPTKARTTVRKVAARKTLKRRSPSPNQESLHASTEDNSSEETQSSRGDSSSGNSGKITTQSQPDLPPSASRKRPVPEPVAPKLQSKRGRAVNAQRADAPRGLERNRKPLHQTKRLQILMTLLVGESRKY